MRVAARFGPSRAFITALVLLAFTATHLAARGHDATVTLAGLPPEAQHTVRLIRSGGPFPYSRDGVVFANREGRLPRERRGYYHEYTVPTPGARDRGVRRVVQGERGELYYTDDHYRTFRRIRE